MVLIWFWCLYSKKRFLLKGDLELLSSEDFECFGVAFLYGPAFSMFMLGSSSSWALLFLQHIQENSNPLVPPDASDYKPCILVQTLYVFA